MAYQVAARNANIYLNGYQAAINPLLKPLKASIQQVAQNALQLPQSLSRSSSDALSLPSSSFSKKIKLSEEETAIQEIAQDALPLIPPDAEQNSTTLLENTIREVMSALQTERNAKFEQLSPQEKQQINHLETTFTELTQGIIEWAKAADLLDSFSTISKEARKTLKTGCNQWEKFIEGNLAQLITSCPELRLERADFCFWRHPEDVKLKGWQFEREYTQERLLNRCVNLFSYLREVHKHLYKHMGTIISEFFPKNPLPFSLEELEFQVKPMGSETHNQGRVPCLVTVCAAKLPLFKLFYKGRNAQIDAWIIETFSKINALANTEKSSPTLLPEYKILLGEEGGFCYSMWEFIPGYHPPRGNSIDMELASDQKYEFLLPQLLRLESICKYLDISDLHEENVIIETLMDGKLFEGSRLVPIDLESIQSVETGLFREFAPIQQLTTQEITVLEAAKEKISQLPYRAVPLPTHLLSRMDLKSSSIHTTAENLVVALEKEGYQVDMEREEIEKRLIKDFLNHDVPYFVAYQNDIYYGHMHLATQMTKRASRIIANVQPTPAEEILNDHHIPILRGAMHYFSMREQALSYLDLLEESRKDSFSGNFDDEVENARLKQIRDNLENRGFLAKS